jgi:hypothetical protein
MQVEHHVDRDRRIIFLTLSGELNDQRLPELFDLIARDPDTAPDFSLLVDVRGADAFAVSPRGVRAVAARQLALSPQSRRAVVVPNAFTYGMARMYEILRGRRGGMRVFRDYDAALRWIETGLG